MAERSKPPFRADHVGSLIRPQALIEARERAEKRELAEAELKRIQQAAIREVVRMQEDLGLKLVTDGEYNRSSWHRDFMLKFANVRMIPSKLSVRFHSADGDRAQPADHAGDRQAGAAAGRRHLRRRFQVPGIDRARDAEDHLPSPTVMHFRGGREAIDAKAYPDIAAFYDDLARSTARRSPTSPQPAAAICRSTRSTSPICAIRSCAPQVANIGEDPATLPETYAKLLNDTIAGTAPRI